MTTARFRPHERLRDSAAFRRAFDRRKSASDERLIVHASENGMDCARIGIVVSRKRMRHATDRNHFKRIVRETFRLTRAEWPVGFDYIVLPRGKTPTLAETIANLPALARAVARRLAKNVGPAATPPEPPKQP
ncbi:ribonuclease P protein component [Isosphaeraceae bacterium EP7]